MNVSRVHIAPKCDTALPWVRSNTPATREVIGWMVLDIIKMQAKNMFSPSLRSFEYSMLITTEASKLKNGIRASPSIRAYAWHHSFHKFAFL